MEKIELLTGYINSAVPYAWDDSESWFEFLAKMLKKINEVVGATNAYFGVDIESFVTEKLIEWKNDGTLQALISENLETQLTENLNKIKDITGINIHDFIKYSTNYSDITPKNELDWTEPFKQAIAHCVAYGYHKIIVPNGLYRITNTLDLTNSSLIEIEGVTNAQMYPGMGAKSVIKFENCEIGMDLGRSPYVTLKNLELNGANSTNINLNFGFFTRLINVSLTNALVAGGKITKGQCSIYENCSFSGNNVGLILEDIETTTQTFINCFFRENQQEGIKGETSDCYFLRCVFESNIGKSIHLTNGKKLIKFESCYWEANEMPNGFQLQLENAESTFDNCDFGSTEIVRVANLISSKVEFKNCKHQGHPENVPIDFDGTSKVVLYNSFDGYPFSSEVIKPQIKNEISGSYDWLLAESPTSFDIVFNKTIHRSDYNVFCNVSCYEEFSFTISNRLYTGFTVLVHKKPIGANATFIWKIEY